MSRKISHKLSYDWYGARVVPPLKWTLSKEPSHYFFQVSRSAKAFPHPNSAEGVFREELWHHEVTEVFFANTNGNDYLECNLAPNGAWWACRFTGIRQPATQQPDFAKIHVTASSNATGWKATLRLPDSLLRDFDEIRFNVTAILRGEPVRNKQHFLTHFPLPGKEPDFHQPDAFQALPWCEDS